MRLNNPERQLGKRSTTGSRPAPYTASTQSAAQGFYNGLQSEWILAEGKRIESGVKAALDLFSPVAWARPLNLADAQKDLFTAGHCKQNLEYRSVPSDEGARTIRRLYPLVEKSEHPAQLEVLGRLRAAEAGCNAFSELRRTGTNGPVTRWCLDYYGRPSEDTLTVARSILAGDNGSVSPPETKLTSDQVAFLFEQQLSNLAGGWTVVIEPIQAVMMVRQSGRQIVVRNGLSIGRSEVRRLLVHEIGGHVVRAMNAQRQEGTLGHLKLGADSTATEEGLAIWWEHQLGVQQVAGVRRYAARAIAVDLSLLAGATEVVEALTPHVGREEAVAITLRVKRGMGNIELPGAFTKDHSYLTGYLQVERTLNGMSSPEKTRAVMATKWGLSMLPIAERLIDMGVLLPGDTPLEVFHGLAKT